MRAARSRPPGRLLDPASDGGTRGMVVASPKRRKARRWGHRIRLTAGCGGTTSLRDHMAMYLVTGGAGFIGSHLAEELVRRGERVRVVDNLATGRRENLASIAGRVEFIEGDLANAGVAKAAAAGVDFVLHQA